MKTTGFRSIVLYLLLALFLGGIILLCIRIGLNGKDFVAQPYNGHIYAEDATADTGRITDRNNIVLAQSENGKRLYSENTDIRLSLLHTVGDSSGYIGTSVQSQLRSRLMGYNIFTGLNRTPFTALGGNDVKLTVDAQLCAAAYNALNGKKGSVLIYNYKTGELLCKVSTPGYDPADVPEDLSDNPEYKGVFVDNTLSSAYTPGSIFKLVTAAAAMDTISDWSTRTYSCEVSAEIGGGIVTCLDYHGDETMEQALGHSCNIYFAKLAQDIGAAALQKKGEEMGFNKAFDLQDFSTAKSSLQLGSANGLDLAWASVGQYTVTANPMHMLMMMGAIANSGTAISPRLTDKGLLEKAFSGEDIKLMSSSTASSLKTMMRSCVADYYGDDMFPGLEVCAKTGTAEVDGKTPTSWIAGFSQAAPYAFCVTVEEGGSGMGAAGSIASQLMQMLNPG